MVVVCGEDCVNWQYIFLWVLHRCHADRLSLSAWGLGFFYLIHIGDHEAEPGLLSGGS